VIFLAVKVYVAMRVMSPCNLAGDYQKLQKYIALSLMLRKEAICCSDTLIPTRQTARYHSLQYHDINKKWLDVHNLIHVYSFKNCTYQIQA